MKQEIYIGYLMLVLFGIFILLKLAANFIDHMWYKKKDKPVKVKDKCFGNDRFLTDQEAFFGHCSACKSIATCKFLNKNKTDVKS